MAACCFAWTFNVAASDGSDMCCKHPALEVIFVQPICSSDAAKLILQNELPLAITSSSNDPQTPYYDDGAIALQNGHRLSTWGKCHMAGKKY